MPTTTVKGAGRAKYNANLRHQQRTALPPKNARQRSTGELAVEREQTRIALTAPAMVGTKGEKFAAVAEEYGWRTLVQKEGELETVWVRRGEKTGGELIKIVWTDGRIENQAVTYRHGEYKRYLRNVSAAKVILAVDEKAARTAATPTRRTSKDGNTKTRIRPAKIPFALDAPDAEIVNAIKGRKLVWKNSIAGTFDEATCMKDWMDDKGNVHIIKSITVIIHPRTGQRCLTFPAVESGMRSVSLDRLIQVR